MAPRKFDRFMADNENGRNLKLARFTDAEYRAWFGGVLPIASKADPRGAFMVGSTAATAEDVTHQSIKTSLKAAKAALAKARSLGMLEFDEELGAEWVHDWDDLNPAPKTDPSNARRQAEFRARQAARNGGSNGTVTPPRNTGSNGSVTPPVTPPEVEGEVEGGSGSPVVGGRATAADRAISLVDDELVGLAEQVCGILQRGIDGLTCDEPCKPPSLPAVLEALRAHPEPALVAVGAAVEARSIAQAQNRAPNIAALFASKMREDAAA